MAIRNEFGYASKTIEIGNWNMDTSDAAVFLHGLSATEWKTIRSIDVIIRDDSDTKYSPLMAMTNYVGPTAGLVDGGITYIASTSMQIVRTAGGGFDDPAFSTVAGYNRGWVTFEYIPD
jgi:hypothetical protein